MHIVLWTVQFGAFGRTWYLWEEEAKAAQHWRAQTGTVTKHEFHLRDGRALCDLLNRLNA
jgi:hypothetical protein